MLLDLIFLVILFYFAFKGYQKGAIVTFISSLATFIGVIAALTFSSTVSKILFVHSDNILWMKIMPVLSYLLVFLGSVFLVKLLANFLKKTMKSFGLGSIDKLLGGVISGITVVLMAALFYWLLGSLQVLAPETMDSSKSYNLLKDFGPMLIDGIQQIFPFLKDTFVELKEYFETVHQSVQTNVDSAR